MATCKCGKGCKCASKKITVESLGNGMYRRTSEDSKYIVEYNRDMCIGAASCAAVAPFTFVMDDENKAVLVDNNDECECNSEDECKCGDEECICSGESKRDDDETILAAAQSCPVLAIVIKDKKTGEQIFPPLE